MIKIQDIPKCDNTLITNKEIYTMTTNHITTLCNTYTNMNFKRPNIYISDNIESIDFFVCQDNFSFNSQFYISELLGTLNGFNLYQDKFIEKDKFCICDEREFNILKRRVKIDNILKRIKV